MELAETIETINRQLENLFGTDFTSKRPIFRVVWSEDQFEKREMDVTPEGLQLLSPIVREVPKYRQWIQKKYVLERLVIVPEVNQKELGGLKVSYEPLWVFQTEDEQYLPPKIEVAKFVIDAIYAAMGKKSMRRYVDEEEKNPKEVREERLRKLQEELFGNETDTGDALAYHEGVSLSGPKFEAPSTSPVKENKS